MCRSKLRGGGNNPLLDQSDLGRRMWEFTLDRFLCVDGPFQQLYVPKLGDEYVPLQLRERTSHFKELLNMCCMAWPRGPPMPDTKWRMSDGTEGVAYVCCSSISGRCYGADKA